MKRTLCMAIECGETTCAWEPGKFCCHLGSKKFGTVPVCLLFRDTEAREVELFEKDGWLQRCGACLEREERA
jgi:hypothetical protein